MAFLAAGFLLALTALAIPWWLHRRQTQDTDPVLVGSVQLLQPGPRPESRRRTVRYRALLALRLLLLTLLVLAFAQPVLTGLADSPEIADAAPRLVVVDVSASMQPQSDRARELAAELLQGRAALASAGAQLTVLEPLTNDPQRHAAAVAGLTTTATRLSYENLPARLSTLADSLASSGERVTVHFISDFQNSAAPARFNTLVEGLSHPLILHALGDAAQPNWRVEAPTADQLGIRGINTPEAQVSIQVSAEDQLLLSQTLLVPASGQTLLALPALPPSRHDRRLIATLTPPVSDALDSDNVRYLVSSQQRRRPVAVLGDADQQRYVRTALAAGSASQPTSALTARVAVVVDPQGLAAEFGDYLRAGGRGLVFAGGGSRNDLADILPEVRVVDSLQAPRARRIVAVDNTHPALGRLGGLDDIAVFQHLTMEVESAEVIARLDNGDPWVVEAAVGMGRLLLVGSALNPRSTNLVSSPGFLLFLEDALAYLGEDFTPSEIAAGATLQLPFGNAQILNKAGERMLNLDQSQGSALITLQQPGHYELRSAGLVAAGQQGREASGRRYLAVNVAPAESDLTPMPAAQLQRWREALARGVDAEPGTGRVGADAGQLFDLPLAPGLLLLALVALLAETGLANGSIRTPIRASAESS